MSQHENTMDIPADVLEDQKCYAPKRPATLNQQSEVVAKLRKFPDWKFGCREPVPFASEAEKSVHETACEYRRSMCPDTTDIPVDILEEIKCHNCDGYLSRSPVYLQHDGAGVCGQCYAPKYPATRNTQYEAVVKLLKFPCKNREFGCRETVPFASEAEESAHEAECEYRRYVCPVLGSARCEWVGPRGAMLAHCCEQHPDRVLDNPCILTHDIATTSLHNYIISAFQVLFLLHTKVCVATGKIFHTICLVDGSEQASDYSYTLDIKREDEQVIKKGQVLPEGCLAIQEDSSVAVNTNSLLDMLGGFDGTTFTVTLQRRMSAAAEQLARPVEECRRCEAVLTYPARWCDRCAPAKRSCFYSARGCTYTGYTCKRRKHIHYFCQQRSKCYICKVRVSRAKVRGTLAAHYGSAHQDITYSAGTTWQAKEKTTNLQPRQTGWQNCLLNSAAGTAVCVYKLSYSQFYLEVHTPVPREELHKFRCSVQVTDPATGHTRTFTPDLIYNKRYDWVIELKRNNFPSWNTVLDVCVNISKYVFVVGCIAAFIILDIFMSLRS